MPLQHKNELPRHFNHTASLQLDFSICAGAILKREDINSKHEKSLHPKLLAPVY